MQLLLIILLVLSIGINVYLFMAINRASRIVESYDAFFNLMQEKTKLILSTMRDIDLRGAFQTDDEVGGVFDQMKELIELLTIFVRGVDVEEEPAAIQSESPIIE